MSSSASITACLIQLSAKGVQNTFLDLGPEFTFFKSTYKRHTNYAVQMSTVEVTGGQGNWGQVATFTIPRNGDLLTETYMCGYLPVAGVDTTPCAYMKSNNVVLTNKGVHGPVKGAANNLFQMSQDPSRGHKRAAASTVDPTGVGNVDAFTESGNTKPTVTLDHPLLPDTRTYRTPGNALNGKVVVPSLVSEKGAVGAVTATSVAANKAAQFMAGNDFACVAYCNNLGHAMIQKASFQIGGNEIMTMSGHYMHIWHSLNRKSDDDTQDEQMLFSYGDGTGVPIGDNGSNAPQAVMEDTPPFFDPTNRYKLAQFQLKFPKATLDATSSLSGVLDSDMMLLSPGQLVSINFGKKDYSAAGDLYAYKLKDPRESMYDNFEPCSYRFEITDSVGVSKAEYEKLEIGLSFVAGDGTTRLPWNKATYNTQMVLGSATSVAYTDEARASTEVRYLTAKVYDKTTKAGTLHSTSSAANLQVRMFKVSGSVTHGFSSDPTMAQGYLTRSGGVVINLADSTIANTLLVSDATDGSKLADLASFSASLSAPRITPMTSTTGVVGQSSKSGFIDPSFSNAHHFNSEYTVHNTNPMGSAGSNNVVSFVALCDTFVGGNQLERVGDVGVGGAAAPVLAGSLGVHTIDLSTTAGRALAKKQETNADSNTVTSINTGTKDNIRGGTAHNRVADTDDANTTVRGEQGLAAHATNKISAGYHTIAHMIESDFVTTADYWNGTVGWTGANKRNIRDNFARRCQATQAGNCDHPSGSGRCVKVMVPLPFWFNRKRNDAGNAGRTQALPLIALQYHDCKVQLTISAQKDMVQTDQEARNQAFRFTGCVGAGSGGTTVATMHETQKEKLIKHINESVLLPSTMNGGFCHEAEASKLTTFAGHGVTYGSRTKFFGGPNGGGAPYVTSENSLSCAHTLQGARGDLGARSHCLPGATGTGSCFDPKGDGSPDILDLHLVINCVYLDSNERKLFASHTHEYLIQQVQESMHQLNCPPNSSFSHYDWTITLNLNHPTAVLFFTLQRPESRFTKNHFRYEATHMAGDDILIAHSLKLNSHEREGLFQGDPMNLRVVGPGNYFDSVPAGGPAAAARDPSGGSGNNIYMYSFCQHPREAWPSGNLNFSRIDNATMTFRIKQHANQAMLGHPYIHAGGGTNQLADEIQSVRNIKGSALTEAQALDLYYGKFTKGIEARIYAQSFNVLRIMSGMAAIKYAN
jgi:hypothetical protein